MMQGTTTSPILGAGCFSTTGRQLVGEEVRRLHLVGTLLVGTLLVGIVCLLSGD